MNVTTQSSGLSMHSLPNDVLYPSACVIRYREFRQKPIPFSAQVTDEMQTEMDMVMTCRVAVCIGIYFKMYESLFSPSEKKQLEDILGLETIANIDSYLKTYSEKKTSSIAQINAARKRICALGAKKDQKSRD